MPRGSESLRERKLGGRCIFPQGSLGEKDLGQGSLEAGCGWGLWKG